MGTSNNALEIQIWTTLFALLLLKWLHHLFLAAWSLSNLAAMLRLNFFTCKEPRAWLQHPYHTPPHARTDPVTAFDLTWTGTRQ
ncbi:hypothetical protein DFAR_2180015 [Desulfarculales bacterium]